MKDGLHFLAGVMLLGIGVWTYRYALSGHSDIAVELGAIGAICLLSGAPLVGIGLGGMLLSICKFANADKR